MSNILAVFGTSYGQTERIVRRIASRLEATGHHVTILRGDSMASAPRLDEYDGFLVAASVISGRHQPYVESFVREHRDYLDRVPSAFVSVSGAAGSPSGQEQARARRYIEEFFQATGWRPRVSTTVGGAITYTKYGLLMRWMLMLITRSRGGPTDMSRDYEFTDWTAVDAFGDRLAAVYGISPHAHTS